MQGSLSNSFVFTHIQHALCPRFSALLLQQKCGVHKQTIYEKLNLPPKPKKPETSFLKFLKQVRPALTRENPGAKHTEIVKIAAQKWSTVDSKLKEKLVKEFREEYAAYGKSLYFYDQGLTPEQKAEMEREQQHRQDVKQGKKTKKKAKQLGKPKRPPSAFLKYLLTKKNERTKYPSPKDWVTALGQEWKTLSDDVKSKLMNESKREYEKYVIELKAWEDKMINDGNIDLVRSKSLSPPKKKSNT